MLGKEVAEVTDGEICSAGALGREPSLIPSSHKSSSARWGSTWDWLILGMEDLTWKWRQWGNEGVCGLSPAFFSPELREGQLQQPWEQVQGLGVSIVPQAYLPPTVAQDVQGELQGVGMG